jgi:uroporphyrinogen-III decarboxylase
VQELGPALYKDFAERNNVPLILGVGAAFLDSSTPAEIAQRVRQYVQIGGRGGRFALYLCNIGANTPPQNLRTAVDVAHSIDLSQIV